MDLDDDTSTARADDKECNSLINHNSEEIIKEKCELLYEVDTICSTNNVLSECKYSDKNFKQDLPTQYLINYSHENFSNYEENTILTETEQYSTIFGENQKSNIENIKFSKEENLSSNKMKENEPFPTEKIEDSNSNESTEQVGDIKRISKRNSKRKKEFDECCPICGVTVRRQDLEYHYSQEIEKLSKIPKYSKKSFLEESRKKDIYDEVRRNRESRLTARVARLSARAKNEVKCPVCSLRMSGTAEEINKHVALCIQDEDSDEVIDVDNLDDEENESFEEYEIGDETRIRTISLVPGGYRSLHGNSSRIQTAEDEDLNVDVDDTFTYGDPQYSELDVIPDTDCEKDKIDLEQLRKAVLTNSSILPNILESRKWSKSEASTENSDVFKSANSDPIVSSLKEKIKDLENENKNVKCLICLESYTKPVVSTTCWHVHCEECWLMTMGVKKLCPQCNMIVFPSDLRKIYL